MRSDTIKQVIEAVRQERVIELAVQMCSIPSLGSEGQVAKLVSDVLSRTSAEVYTEEVVRDRPNVIARVVGDGARPPLLLNGHLDATVYDSGWSRSPREPWISEGRLYGGGITDMIGAVACMLAATEAASQLGGLPGDLVFQAVVHHDGTGLGTKYALASQPIETGYAICGEPSGLSIHTGNGGAFKFEIELQGRTEHISRAEDAVDTVPPLIDVYRSLVEHEFTHIPHPHLPDLPRLLVGELRAGSGPAHVAERAVLRGDLRTVPGMSRASVLNDLRSVVNEATGGSHLASVRILSGHQPFLGATEGALISTICDIHDAIRNKPVRVTNELPGQAFVTDAADLVAAGHETVVYGPGEWRHGPDESIAVSDLVDAARIYLGVAYSLGDHVDYAQAEAAEARFSDVA